MLFGREGEVRVVGQALAAARVGKSTRLVIRGEPGIGKSALLEQAVADAGPMRLLSAHGVEFEASVPFAGLHELLGPALRLLDKLPPVHAAALRSSLGLGERIEADRLIVGAAVLGLISSYAENGPLAGRRVGRSDRLRCPPAGGRPCRDPGGRARRSRLALPDGGLA